MIKDALLAVAIGHYITTLPIWEARGGMWLIEIMAVFICWNLIIEIEESYARAKKYLKKRKARHENDKLNKMYRKLTLYRL